jgi:hypothetical protein
MLRERFWDWCREASSEEGKARMDSIADFRRLEPWKLAIYSSTTAPLMYCHRANVATVR